MIRNLKLLAPFSQAANIITFVGISIVMYYVFDQMPSPNSRELAGALRNFSLFFGTTLFALEAVGVVRNNNFNIRYLLYKISVLGSSSGFLT